MKKILPAIYRFLDHCLSLLILFLLFASVAVWNGKILGHDLSPVPSSPTADASLTDRPDANILRQLDIQPDQVSLERHDSATWEIIREDTHASLGYIVCTTPYARNVRGFAGKTPLYLYVSPELTLIQIAPGPHAETPSFYQKAFDGIVAQWKGKRQDEWNTFEVDAVTGATYTSLSLIQNIRNSLDAFTTHRTLWHQAPAIGWWRTVTVAGVLLLSFIAARNNRRHRLIRPLMLLLNVLVLGFWCGQFLSLSLLRGWITDGMDPLLNLPLLCILGVALLTSFFTHKRHYCTWVCPLGSLQSLAALLPLPKIKVNARTARFMTRLRIGAFGLLMTILWLGLGQTLLDYEPFTVFMLQSALPAVCILAGIIVVSSCFVPCLWCRALCPMGTLLDLSEK